MTNEQNEALNLMIEWRDELHRTLMDEKRNLFSENPTLGFAFVGLRNAMNGVAVAFGRESFVQDSSLATATN